MAVTLQRIKNVAVNSLLEIHQATVFYISLAIRPVAEAFQVRLEALKQWFTPMEPYMAVLLHYTPLTIFSLMFLLDMYVLRQYSIVYGDNAPWKSQVFLVLKQFHHFYFTGWNFSTQVFFLAVAICDEILQSTEYDPDIQNYCNRIRSYVFVSLVFPCSLLVTLTFWGLYIYNREVVFPSVIDEFYPHWLNHAVHTLIMVPLVVEVLTPKNQNFITIDSAMWGLTVYLLAYQTVYLSVYFFYGFWLYPIFMYMTWVQKMLFLWIEYVLTVSFLTLGVHLQNMKIRVD